MKLERRKKSYPRSYKTYDIIDLILDAFMFLFFLRHATRSLLFIVVLLAFLRGFIIEPGRVNGISMEPIFMDEEFFFVNKYTLLLRVPDRGDVVQAVDPLSKSLVIKRVIGLPGEQLSIHSGAIYLRDEHGDEVIIEEPWLSEGEWTTSSENGDAVYVPIPNDHYFLIGDNRDSSTDSRTYGAVHRNRIYGLVHQLSFSR